jgi:uncharacterized protein DUF1566
VNWVIRIIDLWLAVRRVLQDDFYPSPRKQAIMNRLSLRGLSVISRGGRTMGYSAERWLWLSAIGLMLLLSGSLNAQTSAPGPYYAWPAWDQKLQCDTQAMCPRFIVLLNWNSEAVLDRETGLVWERAPSATKMPAAPPAGSLGGIQAATHCNDRTVGNRRGWRVPSIQELMSLVDPSQPFVSGIPQLPLGHPFQFPPNIFGIWSSNPYFNDPRFHWYYDVHFFGGTGIASDASEFNVWCVRGGSANTDTQ